MKNEFIRTALILGENSIEKLQNSAVAVFGIGGVGSYVAECLARAGVGHLILVDNDTVARSNINRQLIALQSTVGMYKTEVAAKRIMDINSDIKITVKSEFFSKDTLDDFDFDSYDYIIDAIDSVTSKLLLIETAHNKNIPIISSMGMGNKIHPEMIELADISKTTVCPLARVIRTELKKRKIYHLKCAYSKEQAIKPDKFITDEQTDGKRQTPGSVSFVPSAAGLIIGGAVVRDITGCE